MNYSMIKITSIKAAHTEILWAQRAPLGATNSPTCAVASQHTKRVQLDTARSGGDPDISLIAPRPHCEWAMSETHAMTPIDAAQDRANPTGRL
jgi:hypothetical protein